MGSRQDPLCSLPHHHPDHFLSKLNLGKDPKPGSATALLSLSHPVTPGLQFPDAPTNILHYAGVSWANSHCPTPRTM